MVTAGPIPQAGVGSYHLSGFKTGFPPAASEIQSKAPISAPAGMWPFAGGLLATVSTAFDNVSNPRPYEQLIKRSDKTFIRIQTFHQQSCRWGLAVLHKIYIQCLKYKKNRWTSLFSVQLFYITACLAFLEEGSVVLTDVSRLSRFFKGYKLFFFLPLKWGIENEECERQWKEKGRKNVLSDLLSRFWERDVAF